MIIAYLTTADFASRFPLAFPVQDDYGNAITAEEFATCTGQVEQHIDCFIYIPANSKGAKNANHVRMILCNHDAHMRPGERHGLANAGYPSATIFRDEAGVYWSERTYPDGTCEMKELTAIGALSWIEMDRVEWYGMAPCKLSM